MDQRQLSQCIRRPFVHQLRLMAQDRKGPFQPLGRQVKIGIPNVANQPRDNEANVCRGQDFDSRRIELFDTHSGNTIEVMGHGRYECPDPEKFPDIQLNVQTAMRLFERKTDRIEFAFGTAI
jgi:hypothetical protein